MSHFTDKIQRMFRLRKAYRVAFMGERGMSQDTARRVVMQDLERFCRVNQSSVVVSPVSRVVDTHATCVAEGRREVFNRLSYYLNLTEEQIAQLQERTNELT
ncbi:Bbp19 family protein [Achromobacter spanius]|uniref:Bbp19-like phage domain-containing protein n=1 Tax=Achromobacter spanius TaxID=217203 RepID=A0AAW3I5X6_9BURK|nr:hypothetical protein [Achromobacter spanius]KNE28159.1 hypothetical protein AFM18_08310 [Achromobacter spanius]